MLVSTVEGIQLALLFQDSRNGVLGFPHLGETYLFFLHLSDLTIDHTSSRRITI